MSFTKNKLFTLLEDISYLTSRFCRYS